MFRIHLRCMENHVVLSYRWLFFQNELVKHVTLQTIKICDKNVLHTQVSKQTFNPCIRLFNKLVKCITLTSIIFRSSFCLLNLLPTLHLRLFYYRFVWIENCSPPLIITFYVLICSRKDGQQCIMQCIILHKHKFYVCSSK